VDNATQEPFTDLRPLFVPAMLLTPNQNDVYQSSQMYHGENGINPNALHVAAKWSEEKSTHVQNYGQLKNNTLYVQNNQHQFLTHLGQNAPVIAGKILAPWSKPLSVSPRLKQINAVPILQLTHTLLFKVMSLWKK
jgi:hypothetical protein